MGFFVPAGRVRLPSPAVQISQPEKSASLPGRITDITVTVGLHGHRPRVVEEFAMKVGTRFIMLALFTAATALSQTGCFWLTAQGPTLGPLAIPIPVPVGMQKSREDHFWNYERYERAPVLGPIPPGGPCEALDEPSDDEVMRALEKARPVQGNWPFFYEIQRNQVRITKCKISDYVDPPRHYPLVGPAQLHHANYKCTVYFQEVKRIGWPVPYTIVDEDCQEVVYIDHYHLHMVGDVDTGCDAQF